MPPALNARQRQLESFRHHYYTRYGIRLDDELVLMLIRMSELHHDLRREMDRQPRIQFRSARDYFWYGFGQFTGYGLVAMTMTALVVWLLKP